MTESSQVVGDANVRMVMWFVVHHEKNVPLLDMSGND